MLRIRASHHDHRPETTSDACIYACSGRRKPSNAGAFFVLPSQLNGAEYPMHNYVAGAPEHGFGTALRWSRSTNTSASELFLGGRAGFQALLEGISEIWA